MRCSPAWNGEALGIGEALVIVRSSAGGRRDQLEADAARDRAHHVARRSAAERLKQISDRWKEQTPPPGSEETFRPLSTSLAEHVTTLQSAIGKKDTNGVTAALRTTAKDLGGLKEWEKSHRVEPVAALVQRARIDQRAAAGHRRRHHPARHDPCRPGADQALDAVDGRRGHAARQRGDRQIRGRSVILLRRLCCCRSRESGNP